MPTATLISRLFSFGILLVLLLLYPGQNYYQSLYFHPSPNNQVLGVSIDLPPITIPVLTGQPSPQLTAQAGFILDLNSSTILYQKNPHLPLHPASTTKVMTALVALDLYRQDDILTVKTAAKAVGNTIDLRPGDQLTFSDLLYALLVSSANDAAVTLAENYPQGYAAFVELMNLKATSLNMRDSHFTNVSGIESADHRTTVYDLSLLTKEALKSDLIRQIVSTSKKTISSLNTGSQYQLFTTNQLLGTVEGVAGFKTGWTQQAGECLITFVIRDDHPLIIVLLNSQDRFGESKTLIDWVYQNHTWLTL